MKKSTLNRMLELADIKPVIKESKINLSNFALVKESADGNTYAIVRENKKYHIKSTQTKNSLTESEFDYVGGVANKKSFSSFEKATRHLNLMFEEINNHYDVENVNLLESNTLNEKKFVLKMKKKKSAPIEEPVEEPAAEEEFDFGGDEESTEGEEEFDFGGEESTEGEEEFDFDAEEGDTEGEEEFDFDAEESGEESGEESVEEFGGEETDEDLEIDDSEDEIKDIQSTTGKLGQQLRDTEDITSDMQKWVAKSVLSALDLDNMDSEDKKDIIRVVKKKSDEPAEEEVESSEEEFDFEEESMEESYDSYMEDDFNEKEYDEWLSDMETAGIIEPSVGEYDDYDSYMDDVNEMDVAVGDANSGEYPIGRATYESKGKEYRQEEPYDEDNPNIGGDEEEVDGELLLDDIIDDDPNDISNVEAEALYGPNSKRRYDRSDPSRAMRQASKDISKYYHKPAAPGYDLDPVEKWAKHKLPYDTFIDEHKTVEEEFGLPPCDNCDESEYRRESVRKRKTLKEDHLNDKMDSYEQEKAYEDVETVVRRYGMDVELRDKSTSEDPEETLIYLDIVDGDDKLLVSRINSVGDIEVGEMRGNKFTGEPVDSVEDFIEIFVEDLTNKEREQLEMEESIEMSPAPQRAPEEQPSQPETKPGTPDKSPPTERPSRRPFNPPPGITPDDEPGPKAPAPENLPTMDNDVEFE